MTEDRAAQRSEPSLLSGARGAEPPEREDRAAQRSEPSLLSGARGAEPPERDDKHAALEALAARRWRIALSLTATMLATYFGFVLLVAYDKPLLGKVLVPGLSLGILLGAIVIVVAWTLTGIYVRWANVHYDTELAKLRRTKKEDA